MTSDAKALSFFDAIRGDFAEGEKGDRDHRNAVVSFLKTATMLFEPWHFARLLDDQEAACAIAREWLHPKLQSSPDSVIYIHKGSDEANAGAWLELGQLRWKKYRPAWYDNDPGDEPEEGDVIETPDGPRRVTRKSIYFHSWDDKGRVYQVNPRALTTLFRWRKRSLEETASNRELAEAYAWDTAEELARDSAWADVTRAAIAREALLRKDGPTDDATIAELAERLRAKLGNIAEVREANKPPTLGSFASALRLELEAIGNFGRRKLAPKITDSSLADPSASPIPGRFARALSVALWIDVIKPRSEARPPGLAVASIEVFRDLSQLAAGGHHLKVDDDGRLVSAVYEDELPTPTALALTTVEGATRMTLSLAKKAAVSPYFWTCVYWIIGQVDHAERLGVQNPHIIEVPGGNDGLRKAVGVSKKEAARDVRACFDFLHALGNHSAPGRGRFITIYERTEPSSGRGRPKKSVVIEVLALLRPRIMRQLQLAPSNWLIPVAPPHLIPSVGDRRTKAQRVNAAQALFLEAHEQRADVANEGSIYLPASRRKQIFERAGLYHRTHASLRDRFFDALLDPEFVPKQTVFPFERTAGTEPILVSDGRPDRYRFGNTLAPEWNHILEQGQISNYRTDKGKAGAEKKRQRVKDHAAKKRKCRK